MSDVLFVLKKRELVSSNSQDWNYVYSNRNSSGLYNSVKFVNDMLVSSGIDSHMYEAIDNNYIYKEINRVNPKVVIIEALWVVPEKFDELIKLYPDIKWVVRLHSEIPFLSVEGIAFEWLYKLANKHPNLYISSNSKRALKEVEHILDKDIIYTPNFYPVSDKKAKPKPIKDNTVNVGCFGAVRVLKNHLMQAIVAMQFADYHGYKLRFHINSSRKEMSGEPVLKNLIALFAGQDKHELVQHEWMPHEEYVKLLEDVIDIAMQVSFTETYNIVAADCIDNNVPVVSSKEIVFVPCINYADPTDSVDIFTTMNFVWTIRDWGMKPVSKWSLRYNANLARIEWLKWLKSWNITPKE